MELFTRNKRFPFAVTGVSVALILYFLAFLNAQSSIAAFVTLAIIAHILIMIATLLTLPEIIYLSKNPEAIFRKWQKTNESEHQRTRMSRALYDGVNLHTYREKFRYALFVGSHGERYFTTLKSCNCMDFQKRNLPCKHMYRLACEMGMPLDLLPDPGIYNDSATVNSRTLKVNYEPKIFTPKICMYPGKKVFHAHGEDGCGSGSTIYPITEAIKNGAHPCKRCNWSYIYARFIAEFDEPEYFSLIHSPYLIEYVEELIRKLTSEGYQSRIEQQIVIRLTNVEKSNKVKPFDLAKTYKKLGDSYLHFQMPEQALSTYKKCVELYPTFPIADDIVAVERKINLRS